MKPNKGEPKLQENPITKVPEVAANVGANQEGAHSSAFMDKKDLSEIIDERNRLICSVMQQPTELLRDLATLAVGWAMRDLELMERQHRAPSDHLAWAYSLRIMGLAEGQYGEGFIVRANDGGSQMFDTSTSALVAQLREDAGVGLKR